MTLVATADATSHSVTNDRHVLTNSSCYTPYMYPLRVRCGGTRLKTPVSTIFSRQLRTSLQLVLRSVSTTSQPRYYPSRLGDVEDLELYRPGGFHPVSIGDIFANGRYRVLHKLGFGGSSTVWLARDQHQQKRSSLSPGILVTLKVLSAQKSSRPKDDIAELAVPIKLDSILRATGNTDRHNVQVIKDYFMEEGHNGTHLCLIY